jgi:hypothetical protein
MTRPRLSGLLVQPRTWAAPFVLLWFLVGLLPFQPTDLDIFFWPSAKVAVDGQPLLVYSAGGQAAYPNANGPVALLPLTLVGLLLRPLGWLDATTPRRAIALAVFSVFILLMAREAVGAIERMRGARLHGWIRLLTFGVLSLSPPVWQSVAGYGHIEQPIEIWLLLVSVRMLQRGQAAGAGIAFGLAVLTRSSAVLQSVPLGLAALRAGPMSAVKAFFAAGATGIAVLVPFLLADRADVLHSLFTYRGNLIVGAGSIWSVTHSSGVEAVIQHWDVVAVVSAVAGFNLWLATRPGGLGEPRLFAGMTLASASFALLAKTVWPYYFFEVFVFCTVWVAGTWHMADGIVRLALAPTAFSIFGLMGEIGSDPDLPTFQVGIQGGAMFVMLGLMIVWILVLASRAPMSQTGMAARTAAFGRHGSERADQPAGPH